MEENNVAGIFPESRVPITKACAVNSDASAPIMICSICKREVQGRKNRRVHEIQCQKEYLRKRTLIRDAMKNHPEIAAEVLRRNGISTVV